MIFVDGVRWPVRGKDAGSGRTHCVRTRLRTPPRAGQRAQATQGSWFRGANADRGRAGGQAGGAVVVRDRGGAAPSDPGLDRSRGNARPVRDRSARAAVGSRDPTRSLLRRPRQALRHRCRSDPPRRSTGDPEGEQLEQHPAPAQPAFEEALEGLRGEIELPIPVVSAVKIGGERAYKLARRGVVVEMPVRRSLVHSLEVVAYTGETVRLALHVSSGTYVRSIARALDGHCTTPAPHRRRSVRRRRVARGRRGGCSCRSPMRWPASRPGQQEQVPRPSGSGCWLWTGPHNGSGSVNVAPSAADLALRPRAVAIGTFDGVHLQPPRGRRCGRRCGQGRRPLARRWSRSIRTRRCSASASNPPRDPRAPARTARGSGRRGCPGPAVPARDRGARAGRFRTAVPGRDRCPGGGRGDRVPLRERRAREISSSCAASASTRARSLWSRACRRRGSAARPMPARSKLRPACSAARSRSKGRSSAATGAAGRSGSRRRTSKSDPEVLVPGFGIWTPAPWAAGAPRSSIGVKPALRRHGAPDRGVPCSTGRANLYGDRLVVQLGSGLRDERAFGQRGGVVEQIARDVEQTTAAYAATGLGVVPKHVGSSGPPWRLRAVEGTQSQGGDPDEASR